MQQHTRMCTPHAALRKRNKIEPDMYYMTDRQGYQARFGDQHGWVGGVHKPF